MRTPRVLLSVLVLSAVPLAFVGVSAATEGDDLPKAVEEEPTTIPKVDCAPGEDTADTTADDPRVDDSCEGTSDEPDPTDDDEATEAESRGEAEARDADARSGAPTNHGAAVSEAAHTCPPGPEHGACVSAVAKSDAGKPDSKATHPVEADGTDDQTINDDEDTDSTDTKPETHRGKGNS